jgi:hypothetical protein
VIVEGGGEREMNKECVRVIKNEERLSVCLCEREREREREREKERERERD